MQEPVVSSFSSHLTHVFVIVQCLVVTLGKYIKSDSCYLFTDDSKKKAKQKNSWLIRFHVCDINILHTPGDNICIFLGSFTDADKSGTNGLCK